MTAGEVPLWNSAPRRSERPKRWWTALFALALAVSGLVWLAMAFAGDGTYEAIARDGDFDRTALLGPAGSPQATARPVTIDALVDLHRSWSAYVIGRTSEPPSRASELFTADEYRHMADVRGVFAAARAAMLASLVALALVVGLALRRGVPATGLLVRDGAIAAGALVLAIALGAAVAFEPLFLLFHYVFFPQGNFLFDPATSNLVRLYPEPYWYGVTLRVGGSFIALAVGVAIAGAFLVRAGDAGGRGGSAMVTRR